MKSALFRKNPQGVSLTEEGEFLYQKAKKIIALCDETEKNLHGKDRIRIMSYYLDGSGRLTRLIDSYQNRNVNTVISLVPYFDPRKRVLDTDKMMKEMDCLITLETMNYDHQNLIFMPLGNIGFQCIVPKNHPLSDYAEITVEDLKNEKVALIEDGIFPAVDHLARELSESCEVIRMSRTIMSDGKLDDCICIITQRFNAVSSISEYIPLETAFHEKAGLYIRKDADAKVRKFAVYLFDNLKEN